MSTPSNTDPDNRISLGVVGDSRPTAPTFSCIVYICRTEDGTISGRVANLAGGDSGEIRASGNSERDVLMEVTREFKSRVIKCHGQGEAIPWIEPPQPPLGNEQVRFIPVHL